MTIQDLLTVAKSINPNFSFDDALISKVGSMNEGAEFCAVALSVLNSELKQGYFETNHFSDSLKWKDFLNYDRSCLLNDIIAKLFNERLDLSGVPSIFPNFDKSNFRPEAFLREDGVFESDIHLPTEYISKVRNILKQYKFYNKMQKKSKYGGSIERNISTLTGVWWLKDMPSFASERILQDIAFDPYLLGVAQRFLGATPIHVQTNAWWTFKDSDTAKRQSSSQNRNAQKFHQDQEFIKFLKIFFYLNDVNEENGPHVYVTGSVEDYESRIPGGGAVRRLEDHEVYDSYEKSRVRKIIGPAGSIIFENTRGFHKGEPVRSGYRLMLQIEYASSLYFNPIPRFPEIEARYGGGAAWKRTSLNYGGNAEKKCRGMFGYLRNLISRIGEL
ncbi:phytanoyl-CoA dioxygenase family protein [Radicibacter daui]|uniref:phytanoyl-CoA dioxygenase family protein n=1 Tax=Radicibacter daui TaxID=3064829 RepID=UPI004046D90B